jgi:branched-chain amino acid aminotransferase
MKVEERKVSVAEVMEAAQNGTLQEAFGCGTAAVVSQIITIGFRGTDYPLPPVEGRKYSTAFAEELNAIRTGQAPDKHGWVVKV